MDIVSSRKFVIEDLAALLGRVLMSALFIWSGFIKLTDAPDIDGYFSSLVLPLPDLARLLAVAVELGGGIALLVGFQARLVALGLGFWCFATALIGHSNFADLNAKVHFMKNVAIAGDFIFIAVSGPGAYTLPLARTWRSARRPVGRRP